MVPLINDLVDLLNAVHTLDNLLSVFKFDLENMSNQKYGVKLVAFCIAAYKNSKKSEAIHSYMDGYKCIIWNLHP